jgi:hypothetical protein
VAYRSAELANVEQTLLGAGSAPAAALDGVNGFGAAVAAPYQMLVANTATNLQSLSGAIAAHPAPLLHQFVANQLGYGGAITTGFQSAVQSLPAELANLPGTAQGVVPAAQQFVNNQIGYAQLITTSLQNAGNDFMAGLHAFPANLQAGLQTAMSGDVTVGCSKSAAPSWRRSSPTST